MGDSWRPFALLIHAYSSRLRHRTLVGRLPVTAGSATTASHGAGHLRLRRTLDLRESSVGSDAQNSYSLFYNELSLRRLLLSQPFFMDLSYQDLNTLQDAWKPWATVGAVPLRARNLLAECLSAEPIVGTSSKFPASQPTLWAGLPRQSPLRRAAARRYTRIYFAENQI